MRFVFTLLVAFISLSSFRPTDATSTGSRLVARGKVTWGIWRGNSHHLASDLYYFNADSDPTRREEIIAEHVAGNIPTSLVPRFVDEAELILEVYKAVGTGMPAGMSLFEWVTLVEHGLDHRHVTPKEFRSTLEPRWMRRVTDEQILKAIAVAKGLRCIDGSRVQFY